MCCRDCRSGSARASCALHVASIRSARQLAEYFAGERRDFVLPLDFRLAHGFRRAVLGHLVLINYGHTESYAEVAAATGRARAVRAVGTACATNPMPVVVPCHRVLRSDGKLGGYIGGPGGQGGFALARVRQANRPRYIVALSAWLPSTTGARV